MSEKIVLDGLFTNNVVDGCGRAGIHIVCSKLERVQISCRF
jgi:hypothetical protein